MNWIIIVYDEHDRAIATWWITNRTEQQASKEAMHEVERHHPGLDWTLMEANDQS